MPTLSSLKQELADLRLLIRDDRYRGLQITTRDHVQRALAVRAEIRRLNASA